MKRLIACATLVGVLLTALGVSAADKKMDTASGSISSVDATTRKVTMLDKKSDEKTITLQKNAQIFKEEKADESAVEDGRFMQMDGKMSEDGKTFTVRQILIYIPKGRGWENASQTRIDGKVLVRDGKWFAKAKDQEYQVEKSDKLVVKTRTWQNIEDIPTGVNGSGYGPVTDEGISAYIFTFQQ